MNAPNLRFKNFNSEWKTTTFEKMCTIRSGHGFKAGEYVNEGIPLVKIDNVGYEEIKKENVSYLPNEYLFSYPELKLVENDIVLALNRPITNGQLKISYISKDFSPSILYQRVGKIDVIDNTKVSKTFLFALLRKEIFDFVLGNSVGSDQPFISTEKLKKLNFYLPDIEEQIKIGELFDLLKQKIQLQQEKIELLKEQKKGFMQKIFSRELRFKNVDGQEFSNWETKTFGDIIKVHSGRDYKHLDLGNIPVYGTGGYMLSVNEALYDKDAIGIGRKGTINQPQKLKAPFWTVDTLFYCTSKESTDLNFIFALFQYINWKKYDESTGVPSLSKKTIESIICNIPCYEEQKMIGSLFNKIDERIVLESGKLTELQNQKQAFMQQMFI
ncbi:restriction endonuclease subunit S [Bacillus sp. JJ1609]|uniref:restriction endonuclease subunit S n=1 Tax=Bacillus sp. JJ1609 TaxID=3122977 RepID=UPI0030000259